MDFSPQGHHKKTTRQDSMLLVRTLHATTARTLLLHHSKQAAARSLSSTANQHSNYHNHAGNFKNRASLAAALAFASTAAAMGYSSSCCNTSSSSSNSSSTKSEAAVNDSNNNNDIEEVREVEVEVELKEYRMSEVKQNDGTNGKPVSVLIFFRLSLLQSIYILHRLYYRCNDNDTAIANEIPISYTSYQYQYQYSQTWVTYGGNIYDITNFIFNHPGGSEKIILAAGGPLEPWWNVYRQHYATDLPMVLMEKMIIGTLNEEDQEKVDARMEEVFSDIKNDPYALEPVDERSELLKVHSHTPMNAEVPHEIITESYRTPNELFYIRHHHPVPLIHEESWRLKVDLTALDPNLPIREFSLQELKNMPKTTITATLQCSGNRRGNFNERNRTSGTSWYQGAISTAEWSGVRLRDILLASGIDEKLSIVKNLEHVRFESVDGLKASVDLEKAMSLRGDSLLAYEMNGEPLPRDHGYPLRTIVPGYVGVRNVKWLSEVTLAESEAEGAWQRGLNYKTLPPSITELTEAKRVDLTKIPAMQQASLFSGITKCHVNTATSASSSNDDIDDTVTCSGWAWAGGGRNVVRVDVSTDGGEHWTSAEITEGGAQKFNRAWAWVFWEATLPVTLPLPRPLSNVDDENKDQQQQQQHVIEVCSKAVDCAYNVQPKEADWNVRGLGNNGWFRKQVHVDLSQSQQKQQ